ncbi:spermidine/putrescine transport system ATP-binding protein [Mumia flava]|uniref:Spermidine/putrescine import ATP-binding protein PotA n=1 Tax=Mumia flava TaxID=1348852 RepID=A0A0B2BNZ8_9ACTN|nr:ABC transporter ATP-binding protein [Mumia flava]PJJ57975.1 spermidine/putrescine transport system ATP-binding protein [Mumia flava]
MTSQNEDRAATVSLRGVRKHFGDLAAVDGVDLDIAEGEFLSLLGPSGCGKTTLLRMIGGFEDPDGGDVLLRGRSVVGLPPHKRTVNTVFQAYALFAHMTVAENVAYGLRQRREGQPRLSKSEITERVSEALALVRMSEYAQRRPKKLSGGQQQRVALARAIVNRPDVLLLDEPLSALDRNLREQMQVELKLIQRQVGITFVFVTHDQSEALSMSDRIVVMNSGKVEQVGTPQEVYERPASGFVAAFVGMQNFADGAVRDGAVATDWATFRPEADELAGHAAGASVRVGVRAESVTVGNDAPTEGDQAENAVAGTLAGTSFLGDAVQHVLLTGDGREVLARTPVDQAEALATGTKVWARWSPSAVRVFAADASEASRKDS